MLEERGGEAHEKTETKKNRMSKDHSICAQTNPFEWFIKK